jgi:hypothetical protein
MIAVIFMLGFRLRDAINFVIYRDFIIMVYTAFIVYQF